MKRFKNILFVADRESEALGPALDRAVNLARRNGARLTVVDVVERLSFQAEMALKLAKIPFDVQELLIQQRQVELGELIDAKSEAGISIASQVLSGSPFMELIRLVVRDGYDLLIKPAGLTDHAAKTLGSTDLHLLRKCPCPVWVDKPGQQWRYQRILVAVDPAEDPKDLSALLMDLATSLARNEGSELHVVHAWYLAGESALRHGRARIPEEELKRLLQETEGKHRLLLDELLEPYSLDALHAQVHFGKGHAKEWIQWLVRRHSVDLIIMGTIGRTGIPGFFIGNTAESVLVNVHCALLAVKPKDFVSPVTPGKS